VTGRCAGPYVGDRVRPVGPPSVVHAFARAARRAGLEIGAGRVVAFASDRKWPRRVSVAVSVTTPYALADADARTSLALFGWRPPAMRALVAVLTGAAEARGRLPVAVPGVTAARCF
jgi:beta-N-acetylhexosaminidase